MTILKTALCQSQNRRNSRRVGDVNIKYHLSPISPFFKSILPRIAIICTLVAGASLFGCATPYVEKIVRDTPIATDQNEQVDPTDPTTTYFYNDFRYYLANRIRGLKPGSYGSREQWRRITEQNADTLMKLYGEEFARIHRKRTLGHPQYPQTGATIPPHLQALCLSGGGIRSASFNAGVLQALHELGCLQNIDYLSSVSGGSYIAAWYMSRHLMDDHELLNPAGPQMRYLLSNGNYLTSGHAGNSALDIVWRTFKHSVTIPFHWLLNGIFSLDLNIGTAGNLSIREFYRTSLADTFLADYTEAVLRDYGEVLAQMEREKPSAKSRIDQVLDYLPGFLHLAPSWEPREPSQLVKLLSNVLQDPYTMADTDRVRSMIIKFSELEDAAQFEQWQAILSDMAGAATLANMAGYQKRPPSIRRYSKTDPQIMGLPCNWYLDDLLISETGLIDSGTTETTLFRLTSSPRPFWIANAGLGLKDDRTLFKNQFGDNFEMTPLYCGSDAIGYVRTDSRHQWMGLSYVLQMSGAAVSETNDRLPRPLGFLITILNLDLGRFVDSWAYGSTLSYMRLRRVATAFYPLHRIGEFFGFDLGHQRTVKARKHFISDGGFYENLGALSVIRRGCRFVIISDAGADPEYLGDAHKDRARAFYDLRRLGLRLRNELGAELVLPLKEESDFGPIMIGEIRNLPIQGAGSDTIKIIYIKPTYPIKDSSHNASFIGGYQASEEGQHFPHQPTSDQFFGEVQLTAYRELGYQTVIQNKDVFLRLAPDLD